MKKTFSLSFFKEYKKYKDCAALSYCHEGKYHSIKYQEFVERVVRFSAGLIKTGARKGDKFIIMHANSPEWIIADFACLFTGVTNVPLYRNISSEHLEFIISQTSPKFIYLSDYNALSKMPVFTTGSYKDTLFIIDDSPGKKLFDEYENISFDEIMEKGKSALENNEFEICDYIDKLSVDDTASIIYTSGTTGVPKGVEISQGNIMAEISALDDAIGTCEGDSIISFLPLSHVLARLVDYFLLFKGRSIFFPDRPEALSKNLVEIKPTLLVGVPRVFDKIYSSIMEECSSGYREKLLRWCLATGEKYEKTRKSSKSVPPVIAFKRFLAEKFLFSRIKDKLGGRLHTLISGGAPLSKDIALFFEKMGLIIQEGYGLTETCCAVTLNRREKVKHGTVGQPLKCADISIAENNEILVRGQVVMKGYFEDKKSTDEVIDKEGWFHTGDAGYLDDENYLVITDRIKELIKTSSGKYVAPQRLESLLTHNEAIVNAIVIGDRKKFITALIVPERNYIFKTFRNSDFGEVDYEGIILGDEVKESYKKLISTINAELESHEKIKNFRLLAGEFSVEGGELTPTFKLKRKFVTEKYSKLIDEMYDAI